MTNTAQGKNAEKAVQSHLRMNGISTHLTGQFAPFDLYTDAGTTIEVKTGLPVKARGNSWRWQFNLHRHGKRRVGSEVDIYILRLEMGTGIFRELGFGYSCYLIIRAKEVEGLMTKAISVRSLLTKHARHHNDFEAIRESDAAKNEEMKKNTVIKSGIGSPWESRSMYQSQGKSTPPRRKVSK